MKIAIYSESKGKVAHNVVLKLFDFKNKYSIDFAFETTFHNSLKKNFEFKKDCKTFSSKKELMLSFCFLR